MPLPTYSLYIIFSRSFAHLNFGLSIIPPAQDITVVANFRLKLIVGIYVLIVAIVNLRYLDVGILQLKILTRKSDQFLVMAMEITTITPAAANGITQLDQPGNSQQTQDCIVTIQEFSQLLQSHPTKFQSGSQSRRQIHRVPEQLRLKGQESERLYEPIMVSLGPYHHGKPELRQGEEFKHLCLDWCASQSEETKTSFYNKILKHIDEIRGCYAEVSILGQYDDKKLALMMLLDACFVINYMDNRIKTKDTNFLKWRNCLGVASAIPFAARDIVLLENQIPFQVLKWIIGFRYKKEEGEDLLQQFLSWMLSVELKQAKIPNEDDAPPLHLLEACWRVIVEKKNEQQSDVTQTKKKEESSEPSTMLTYHTCRSVTDLKTKGIHFSPSPSHSLKDIKFKSYTFNGQLQLPVRYVSEQTQVILTNLIAYEISPDTNTDLAVLSYTNFMKSLIEGPEDVKLLQEKKILFNRFANHEQVVEVFKNIDTFGLVNFDIFRDVKHRIGVHCSSKAKTWVANLIHTRFKSPWTAIGFLAATCLLILTFLQTLYTMK